MRKQIYLAGKMGGLTPRQYNLWREQFFNSCQRQRLLGEHINFRILNPAEYYGYDVQNEKSEKEIMRFELRAVEQSDIVVANLNNVETSVGTIMEIFHAYKQGVPIIGLKTDSTPTHPWIVECVDRIEENMEDLIKYVFSYYLEQE